MLNEGTNPAKANYAQWVFHQVTQMKHIISQSNFPSSDLILQAQIRTNINLHRHGSRCVRMQVHLLKPHQVLCRRTWTQGGDENSKLCGFCPSALNSESWNARRKSGSGMYERRRVTRHIMWTDIGEIGWEGFEVDWVLGSARSEPGVA